MPNVHANPINPTDMLKKVDFLNTSPAFVVGVSSFIAVSCQGFLDISFSLPVTANGLALSFEPFFFGCVFRRSPSAARDASADLTAVLTAFQSAQTPRFSFC